MLQQNISDTAFLVVESRARRVDVSGDAYAQYWVPPERRAAVAALWNDFSREVYPNDDLELGIRNRFFIESIQHFTAVHRNAAFVNLGAGLTSYPYLLPGNIACFELDLPSVVAFKQQRIEELSVSGILPPRNLKLRAVDIMEARGRLHLRDFLATIVGDRPTFFLLEGLSYYLNFLVLDELFEILREAQPVASQVGFDYWRPDLAQNPIFQRLRVFFVERFGFPAKDYCLFDPSWFAKIEGYRVLALSDVASCEAAYAGSNVLSDNDATLPENYAILERL